eukprot:TRINITY_DN28011_c0_g1_i1.p1 TRINITY_DN28011_c0_g1~~TRINITY_DN28011_c0_g1_i1.p1  ORF type:complete len:713 (+),score=113.87 TRINITY_DN28011_c0_g1_i1:90-2228(+)
MSGDAVGALRALLPRRQALHVYDLAGWWRETGFEEAHGDLDTFVAQHGAVFGMRDGLVFAHDEADVRQPLWDSRPPSPSPSPTGVHDGKHLELSSLRAQLRRNELTLMRAATPKLAAAAPPHTDEDWMSSQAGAPREDSMSSQAGAGPLPTARPTALPASSAADPHSDAVDAMLAATQDFLASVRDMQQPPPSASLSPRSGSASAPAPVPRAPASPVGAPAPAILRAGVRDNLLRSCPQVSLVSTLSAPAAPSARVDAEVALVPLAPCSASGNDPTSQDEGQRAAPYHGAVALMPQASAFSPLRRSASPSPPAATAPRQPSASVPTSNGALKAPSVPAHSAWSVPALQPVGPAPTAGTRSGEPVHDAWPLPARQASASVVTSTVDALSSVGVPSGSAWAPPRLPSASAVSTSAASEAPLRQPSTSCSTAVDPRQGGAPSGGAWAAARVGILASLKLLDTPEQAVACALEAARGYAGDAVFADVLRAYAAGDAGGASAQGCGAPSAGYLRSARVSPVDPEAAADDALRPLPSTTPVPYTPCAEYRGVVAHARRGVWGAHAVPCASSVAQGRVDDVVCGTAVGFATTAEQAPWIGVQLRGVAVRPTHYTLAFTRGAVPPPTSWVLEGLPVPAQNGDGRVPAWVTLSTHLGSDAFEAPPDDGPRAIRTFLLPRVDAACVAFRVFAPPTDPPRPQRLALHGLEVYGDVAALGVQHP